MARARNIKPGFFKNEDLAECSVWARLCFALLPMLADREGRLEDRPKRIKGEMFPFDSVEVGPLLAELELRGMVARYTVNSLNLIQILGFRKHQNPHHREPESALPPHPSLRLDGDGKYVQPKACDQSKDTEASDKPVAKTPSSDVASGSSRADSLIPDTLIPEEENPGRYAPPLSDPWSLGVSVLRGKGVSEDTARRMIGKWLGEWDESDVSDALTLAADKADPKAYVMAVLSKRSRKTANQTKVTYRHGQATIDGFVA